MPDSSIAAPPARVTLKEASKIAALPEMVAFHRRVNRWFLALREAARTSGVTPVRIGPVDFDCLDGMRQQFNIANGAALAAHDAMLAVMNAYPRRPIEIDLAHPDSDWNLAAAVLSEKGRRVRIVGRRSLDFWQRLRLPAYRLKRYLLRRTTPSLPPSGDIRDDILCLPRMPGHLADLLPVAEVLRTRYGRTVRFAVVDRRLCATIMDAGFEATALYGVAGPLASNAKRLAAAAARGLRDTMASMPPQMVEGDRCLTELLSRRSRLVLNDGLADSFRCATSLGDLLDARKPRAIIVGNPYTTEGRIAIDSARARGIKTFAIEHGSIFPDDPCWSECRLDEMFAWGQPSRRALMSCGVAEAQITVTGGPRHDVLFTRAVERSRATTPDDYVLVAVSGPGDNISLAEHLRFIDLLHRAAELTSDLRWVVKLHRKDRPEYYRRSDAALASHLEIVTADYLKDGRQIFELLGGARALVTVSSTCAVDAMAVGVPVAAVDIWPEGHGIGVEYLHAGACRRVRTAEALADEVRRAFQGSPDPATMAAAERYAADHFVNRGRAAESVAERIVRQLSP